MCAGNAPEHRVGRGRRAVVVQPLEREVGAEVAVGAGVDRQVLGGPEDVEDEQRGLAHLRHRPIEGQDQPAEQRVVEGHVSDLRVGRAVVDGELGGGALRDDVRVRDHPGRVVDFDVFRVVAFAGRVFAFGRVPVGDFQRGEDIGMAARFRGRRNALEFVDVAGRRLGGTHRGEGDGDQPGQQREAKVAAQGSAHRPAPFCLCWPGDLRWPFWRFLWRLFLRALRCFLWPFFFLAVKLPRSPRSALEPIRGGAGAGTPSPWHSSAAAHGAGGFSNGKPPWVRAS